MQYLVGKTAQKSLSLSLFLSTLMMRDFFRKKLLFILGVEKLFSFPPFFSFVYRVYVVSLPLFERKREKEDKILFPPFFHGVLLKLLCRRPCKAFNSFNAEFLASAASRDEDAKEADRVGGDPSTDLVEAIVGALGGREDDFE